MKILQLTLLLHKLAFNAGSILTVMCNKGKYCLYISFLRRNNYDICIYSATVKRMDNVNSSGLLPTVLTDRLHSKNDGIAILLQDELKILLAYLFFCYEDATASLASSIGKRIS